jgi:hypothetical protein
MLAEAVKDPFFADETRHADEESVREVADALRQDGALIHVPEWLRETAEA